MVINTPKVAAEQTFAKAAFNFEANETLFGTNTTLFGTNETLF
jgi:hypothetical protein